MNSEVRNVWVPIPLAGCVPSGKSLCLSVPQPPHCHTGMITVAAGGMCSWPFFLWYLEASWGRQTEIVPFGPRRQRVSRHLKVVWPLPARPSPLRSSWSISTGLSGLSSQRSEACPELPQPPSAPLTEHTAPTLEGSPFVPPNTHPYVVWTAKPLSEFSGGSWITGPEQTTRKSAKQTSPVEPSGRPVPRQTQPEARVAAGEGRGGAGGGVQAEARRSHSPKGELPTPEPHPRHLVEDNN